MGDPHPIVRPLELRFDHHHWRGHFAAMGCPCEVLLAVESEEAARRLLGIAAAEAWRIEQKYSRYRDDNIVHWINRAAGEWLTVDEETARLLDYADLCHRLSEGRFDITSGILRRVWRFRKDAAPPAPEAVEALLERVGWEQVEWRSPRLRLPEGMEIDLGGIGKEYAVDRVAGLLAGREAMGYVVNFGGDLAVRGLRSNREPWVVGIRNPRTPSAGPVATLRLTGAGLATSGDAERYLEFQGRRYAHILDPRTGWPVEEAPASVTVLADNCTEAGMLATFAMLHGAEAERFLEAQGLRHWVFRA